MHFPENQGLDALAQLHERHLQAVLDEKDRDAEIRWWTLPHHRDHLD
jgi:phage terminase large subunit GpA-like protein